MEYEISTEKSRLDIDVIHHFLRNSYWAKEIPRNVVERSIEHSLCFGVYLENRQVGFARVISDFATFAYLADVFVLPEHRGQKVALRLIKTILAHPDLQGLRRFLLATKDAHAVYARLGFEAVRNPEYFMSIHNPDIYLFPA